MKTIACAFLFIGLVGGFSYLVISVMAVNLHPHGKYGDLASQCDGVLLNTPAELPGGEFNGNGRDGWTMEAASGHWYITPSCKVVHSDEM